MKHVLIRLFSSGLLAATIGVGAVQAASIHETGPGSVNKIVIGDRSSVRESNSTSVNVSNSNHQSASTGNAIVRGNTRGGNATSGNASNSNSESTSVSVKTSAPVVSVAPMSSDNASISDTGPDSVNKIVVSDRSSVVESNSTSVNVSNSNDQSARSGNAIVARNTFGGSATSGDARNSNWQSTSVNVSSSSHASMVEFSAPSQVKSDGRDGEMGIVGNHNPESHRLPTRPDDGQLGSNPCCIATGEANQLRKDRDHARFGDDRRPVVILADHDSRPARFCPPKHRNDCEVSGCRTIRPPCQVVAGPCHRTDCGHQQNCHRVCHRHHHQVHDCGSRCQQHPVCR